MVYIIKGFKWFDKVNGNTYNSYVIFNEDGRIVNRGNLEYGYGNDYFYRGKKWLEENIAGDYKIVDVGASYTTKKNARMWSD